MTFTGKRNILFPLGKLIIFAAEIFAQFIRYNKYFCGVVFDLKSLFLAVFDFTYLAAGRTFYRQFAAGFDLCINFYL